MLRNAIRALLVAIAYSVFVFAAEQAEAAMGNEDSNKSVTAHKIDKKTSPSHTIQTIRKQSENFNEKCSLFSYCNTRFSSDRSV